MKTVVLYFPSIVELVDFSLVMSVKSYNVNRSQLAIIANFSPADIEVALKKFKAKIVMPPENGNE
jgi:hypothetical protein